MTRLETSIFPDGALILVNAKVTKGDYDLPVRLVLDTGAAMTTLTPTLLDKLGYGPRDGVCRTRIRSALGQEEGYVLRVEAFAAMNISVSNFEVQVFDLGFEDLDGLLGMNFLNALYYDVRFAERRILVEQVTSFDLVEESQRENSPRVGS